MSSALRPGPAGRPASAARPLAALMRRVVFVGMTMVLTGLGVVLVGDPAVQWRLPLLPSVALIGPVSRLLRDRSVTRAGRAGPPR
ncbi:MAG: hypothetical protein HYR62_04355 [Actinobacteria bacterium]|nr:hypothetical protein [Actinomycetota bacterium]MBI3685869.1 hypothetical protein [Actinomycetota bacterium]